MGHDEIYDAVARESRQLDTELRVRFEKLIADYPSEVAVSVASNLAITMVSWAVRAGKTKPERNAILTAIVMTLKDQLREDLARDDAARATEQAIRRAKDV